MDTLLNFLQRQYLKKLDCKLKFLLADYSNLRNRKKITEWCKNCRLDYYLGITRIARDFYIGSDLTEEEKINYYRYSCF
jgi:hypothetical protein